MKLEQLLRAAATAPHAAIALRGDAIGVSTADASGFAFDRGALGQAAIGEAFGALWNTTPHLIAYD